MTSGVTGSSGGVGGGAGGGGGSSASAASTTFSLSSAIESSLLSLKPMFDLTPVDVQSGASNRTVSLYSHIFGFERLFESRDYVDRLGDWMQRYWTYSILFSLVYVALVAAGRRYMRARAKYELRAPLAVWNVCLALFSITGAVRVWPEFVHVLATRGVVHSVCDSSYAYGITGFWAFMFIMSKLPELVDTFFIVLRKQELIFLHWYHHATVLVYCWFSYKDFSASGRWFMNMNYLVHSIMYSYYACKALRIRVPVFISKVITGSQLLQMVAGCAVNWLAYRAKQQGHVHCGITDANIWASSLMYLSYFVLFFNFFVHAYVLRSRSRQAPATAAAAAHQSSAKPVQNGHTLKDINNNNNSENQQLLKAKKAN